MTYKGLTDTFVFGNMAVSAAVEYSGRLQINSFLQIPFSIGESANLRSTRLVVVLLPVFLNEITGIPLGIWQFFALIGILLPLTGYVFARRLLGSEVGGLMFGAFVALESDNLYLTYNLNIVGYGYLFYILMMWSTLLWTRVRSGRGYYLLSVLFFAMALMSYYVAEFYALTFLIVVWFLVAISRRRDGISDSLLRASAIAITMVLLFEPLVTDYVAIVVRGQFRNIFGTTANYVSDVIKLALTSSTPVYIKAPRYIFPLNILAYLLVVAPIAYFFYQQRHAILTLRVDRTTAIFIAIFATGAINALLYMGWGGFLDTKYFLFGYPIITIGAVLRWRRTWHRQNVRNLYVLLLLVVLFLRLSLFVTGPWSESYLSRTLTSQNDFTWISDHTRPVDSLTYPPLILLGDTEVEGRALFAYAAAGHSSNVVVFSYRGLNESSYIYTGTGASEQLLESVYSARGAHVSYIVIFVNNLNEPIYGDNWITLPPLSNSGLFNGTGTNIVYSGYRIILFKIPD